MNDIVYLVYQFLPIAIGIIFIYLIKSLNIFNPKIQIATPMVEELLSSCGLSYDKITCRSDVTSKVRELLIINGKLPKNSERLFDYAIVNAGIAYYANITEIPFSLKKSKTERLTIVLSDPKLLSRKLMETTPLSGLLLAYLLEEKLDVVSLCT